MTALVGGDGRLGKSHLERTGHSEAEAAQIAAHATRDRKQILTPKQVLAAHKETAESFSNDAVTVVDVKLDKGTMVQLYAEQARHIEHGYVVESIKPGAPERVLFTRGAAVNEREAASLSRLGTELNLYMSDGSVSNDHRRQNQLALPEQQQIEASANANAPEPVQNEIRRSLGR